MRQMHFLNSIQKNDWYTLKNIEANYETINRQIGNIVSYLLNNNLKVIKNEFNFESNCKKNLIFL